MEQQKKFIMLVDDNRTNLLTGKIVLSEDYTVLTAPSAQKMFEALEWRHPELILLDVDMPDMNGFEAIKILKADNKTKGIPVIFLTAMNESANELEGLQLGAIDYIIKPFSPPLLRQRISLHLLLEDQKYELTKYNNNLQELVELKTKTIVKLKNKIITTMTEMVEGRDGTTGNHILNTQLYLKYLLEAVINKDIWPDQTNNWDIELLTQCSQLHDIGKISISDNVLKKPGKLTEEEFNEMKKHVLFGINFIEKIEDIDEENTYLDFAKIFIAFHHEKWDGSGYPHGLAGENIPLLGRIMAIADVYDALTSERPYKKAFSHNDAIKIIKDGKETHFDPTLIDILLEISDIFKQNHKIFNK
jgi:putative two-component system response regulator